MSGLLLKDHARENDDWRRGVKDAIAVVQGRRNTLAAFNTEAMSVQPGVLVALDETIISLRAMLLRGHAKGETTVAE